jgi:hypothetical protein
VTPATARSLARVAGIATAVLVSAVAAANARTMIPGMAPVVASASVFLLFVISIGLFTPNPLVDGAEGWRIILALAVASAVVAAIGPTGVRMAALLVMVYAAWMEEAVFRRILPRAIADTLSSIGTRRAAFSGIAASQALFAATHFLPGAFRSTPDLTTGLRLFVGGLLLWVIASRAGLTAAVVAHALLNVRAVLGDAAPRLHPTDAVMALIGALCLVVIVPTASLNTLQPLTSRTRA